MYDFESARSTYPMRNYVRRLAATSFRLIINKLSPYHTIPYHSLAEG